MIISKRDWKICLVPFFCQSFPYIIDPWIHYSMIWLCRILAKFFRLCFYVHTIRLWSIQRGHLSKSSTHHNFLGVNAAGGANTFKGSDNLRTCWKDKYCSPEHESSSNILEIFQWRNHAPYSVPITGSWYQRWRWYFTTFSWWCCSTTDMGRTISKRSNVWSTTLGAIGMLSVLKTLCKRKFGLVSHRKYFQIDF